LKEEGSKRVQLSQVLNHAQGLIETRLKIDAISNNLCSSCSQNLSNDTTPVQEKKDGDLLGWRAQLKELYCCRGLICDGSSVDDGHFYILLDALVKSTHSIPDTPRER